MSKWIEINSTQKAAISGVYSMIITKTKGGLYHSKAVYGFNDHISVQIIDAIYHKTEQSAKIGANKKVAILRALVEKADQ